MIMIAGVQQESLDRDASQTTKLPLPDTDYAITRIEPVALLTSILGWTLSLLEGNDLGKRAGPEAVYQEHRDRTGRDASR